MANNLHGLKASTFGKRRAHFLDYDYLHKLDLSALSFLAQFNDEYYGGNLKKDDLQDSLHQSEAQRKDCIKRSNQKSDAFSNGLATKKLLFIAHEVSGMSFEDALLEIIDGPLIICSSCHDEKPADDFSKDRYRKNGRKGYCKPCQKDYAKAYRQRKVKKKKPREARKVSVGISL